MISTNLEMSKIIANGSKMNNISHPVEDVNHSLISGRVLPDLRFLTFKDGYSRESLNIYILLISLEAFLVKFIARNSFSIYFFAAKRIIRRWYK